MQERMEFLKRDLMHLFDDQGIDQSQYEDVVEFLDPITKYSNVQGYVFNINMLKSVFSPTFELHDIRQTGEAEATTRWTMTMRFEPARALGLGRLWDPRITFTGTSAYGFNPATGKINRHVDTWDSVQNQRFFSLEAFGDFWRQMLQTYTTPSLETPKYTLLRRAAKYEVRRYEPFAVAQAPLDNLSPRPAGAQGPSSSSSSSNGAVGPSSTASANVNPASAGIRAFNVLAGYIFGKNSSGSKMAMTTPVLSSTDGTMQFPLPGAAAARQAALSSLPAPTDPAVRLVQQPGGVYAAATFSGVATPRECARVQRELAEALAEAGLRPADPGLWTLARYNDPSVPPKLRRNEVLMQLEGFDLWAS